MNCIVLAAGYGTRLLKDLTSEYAYLQEYPKALLPLGKTCLLDKLLEWLPKTIHKKLLVTNDKYYDKFTKHLQGKNFTIINDKTKTPETRKGAIGDLLLALDQMGEEDFVLLASDMMLYATFEEMNDIFESRNANVQLSYVEHTDRIKQKGVLELDPQNKITGFEEKPQIPKTRNASTPVYFIKKDTIPYIRQYAREHPDKLDRPGDMMGYLVKHTTWYAIVSKNQPYDIVGLDSYKELLRAFQK
ncbi:NTP transferase domain-containing protein [Candidatus Woesearchaeota archaeon]|nr:NTP transferase domain-containing protein [Candidatus Woesearchaeota archaeon]